MALREAKKLAEEKKRERLEEKRARYKHYSCSGHLLLKYWCVLIRERVREQIAKDKAEREAALKKEKEQSSTASQQQKPSQPTAAPAKKEYDTCRLQVAMYFLKYINCLFSYFK